ncbi:hypothetical protein BJ742DRAFT_66904 [Cladochytrium replicatum]|nr:hypothetical protein BJ742DRAFT_66904 [Cladochytrium replicatum]
MCYENVNSPKVVGVLCVCFLLFRTSVLTFIVQIGPFAVTFIDGELQFQFDNINEVAPDFEPARPETEENDENWEADSTGPATDEEYENGAADSPRLAAEEEDENGEADSPGPATDEEGENGAADSPRPATEEEDENGEADSPGPATEEEDENGEADSPGPATDEDDDSPVDTPPMFDILAGLVPLTTQPSRASPPDPNEFDLYKNGADMIQFLDHNEGITTSTSALFDINLNGLRALLVTDRSNVEGNLNEGNEREYQNTTTTA